VTLKTLQEAKSGRRAGARRRNSLDTLRNHQLEHPHGFVIAVPNFTANSTQRHLFSG
jgi:hypothetical protein